MTIAGFYSIIGNVKPEHRSRMKDIHLALLCKTCHKKYSFSSPIIDDLKVLETIGITITFEESTHQFFATISMAVADNLGAHAIGGYYQNFSTVDRFCRACNQVKADVSKTDCHNVVRTKEAYDA